MISYHKPFANLLFFFITAFVWSRSTPLTSLEHHTSNNNRCTNKERHALLHFKSHIHHDPDGYLSTWTSDEENKDCCYWRGVMCNNHSRVTSLTLLGASLEGTISPSLLNLSYLNCLDLSINSFSGTIPKFIVNLSYLNYLDLSDNSFSGTFPKFIGSMTQLTYLNLGWNYFTGTIPSQLGNLTNLQWLSLSSLSSCTIENLDWLSHLSHLETLLMSGTSLAKVDYWVNVILSLQKLSALYLDGCDLSDVMRPYSYSYANSSLSSSVVTLSLQENNLNSSMYHWLFPLTSNVLEGLHLSRNKLNGIPKYLCSLKNLEIYGNSMPIKLPDFLSNLSQCTSDTLQYLDATFSQFTGSLSDHIQNFSSLQRLDLSNNQLHGTISEKVWLLPKLRRLDVSSNFLKGAISENIGKSNLLTVNLSNNSLQGVPLEAHMSNISSIEIIDLSSCKLGPHFPKWILTMKYLSSIDLSNNQISDKIPEDFWNTWPYRLSLLNVSFNNITGIVTDMLSNFDLGFSVIDLSSNNFYGRISNVSSSLNWLDLSNNKLSGEIFFLCQIVDGSLCFLDLSHNSFIGQIPDCLWNFKELKVLDLGYNNLSGRLPTSIKFLINLQVLHLYNNNFSGKFPLSLKNLTRLTFLNLGANKFSGYVPGWIGERLSGLYALILTSNKFIGTIPSHLCQLQTLQILDLSMNKLQGFIPSCLNNLTFMVQDVLVVDQNVHADYNSTMSINTEYVDHSMIKWQGSVREFSRTLELVKIINLSSNNLSGKIPDELTDLYNLIALDLSMNALVGEIPSNIGKMKCLQIFDISRNNISGEIPSSMSQISLLNYLDVSYNNLSGRIPLGTQLQSFEPSRYIGNARLCGLPLSKYCPGDKELEVDGESESDEEGIDDLQWWFYIGGAIGFSIGFWIVCTALLVNHRGRRTFFHIMDISENWVYVKVMVFISKVQRVRHP